jgi:hypothetical protein
VILSLARQGARASVAIVLGLTLAYAGIMILVVFVGLVILTGVLLPLGAAVSVVLGRRR